MTEEQQQLYDQIFGYHERSVRMQELLLLLQDVTPKITSSYGENRSGSSRPFKLNAHERHMTRNERYQHELESVQAEMEPVRQLSHWLIRQRRELDDSLVRFVADGGSLRDWERKHRVGVAYGKYAGRRLKKIVIEYIGRENKC